MKKRLAAPISVLLLSAALVHSTENRRADKMNNWEMIHIMPCREGHIVELARDAENLIREGACTKVAAIMTLVPMGNPVGTDVSARAEWFNRFRREFKGDSRTLGILLQATIGHGWAPDDPCDFQKIVRPNGEENYQMCPLGEPFREYLAKTITPLAELQPAFFMVDDDFRLLTGRGGCFCPLHLARFNREEKTGYTRESLLEAIKKDPALAAKYDALLKTSLVEAAQIIRKAIDRGNGKNIPCAFCCCSGDLRHAPEIARVLQAPGHAPVVRINNHLFVDVNVRTIPNWLRGTERQIRAFPGDFVVLDEPDIFPHNNYAVSAQLMHAHLTHAILSGCRGGKLWLTRTQSYEPVSGLRYRQTLQRYHSFYRTLGSLDIQWQGIANVIGKTPEQNFPDWQRGESVLCWNGELFGKMGFPVYYTTDLANAKLTAFTAEDCALLSDEEIAGLLAGSGVLLDGNAAIALSERGFSHFTGAKAVPYCDPAVSFEQRPGTEPIPVAADLPVARLQVQDGTEVLSKFYHRFADENKLPLELAAGATFFQNETGGKVGIFALSVMPFGFRSFTFLNETRKAQFIAMLEKIGALDWYIAGDQEVLFRQGKISTGDLLVVTNLSWDPMPEIVFGGAKAEAECGKVQMLAANGQWQDVTSRKDGKFLKVQRELSAMGIAVLRILRQ